MDEKENTRELVVVDVKRYKKVKKALEASEERFRLLFENVPIGIYRTTPDGRIIDSNPALVKMLGYESFAELARHNLEKDFSDAGYLRSNFIKALKRDGEVIGLESIWSRKDGSNIHVRENAKLIHGEGGEIFFEGTVEDITLNVLAAEAQSIRSQQLEILNYIIANGNMAESLQEMLEIILHCVNEALGFDTVAVFLYDAETKQMDLAAARGGKKKQNLDKKYTAIGNMPFAKVLRGEPVFVDHARENLPDLAKQWGWRAAGSIPLVSKGRVIGALNAASRRRAAFSPEEKDILELIGKEAGTLVSKLQTETALRKSEQYYRTLIDTSPEIIFVLDFRGTLVMVNQRFLHGSGYFYDEVVGHNVLEFAQGVDPAAFQAGIKLFLKSEKLGPLEYPVKKKDGTYFPMEMTLTLLTDEKGDPSSMMGVGRDISQRKRDEERLRFLGSITENTSEAIIVTDIDFHITYINKVAEKFFGYALDELKGRTPEIFNVETNAAQIQENLYKIVTSGKTYIGESMNRRKDGSIFYCEYKVMPLKDNEGRIYAYSSVQRDISERKHSEAVLRQSEETFRRTFEAIPDPAYVWSRQQDGRLLLSKYNQAAEQITCGGIKDFLGVEAENLFTENPDFVQKIRLAMEQGQRQFSEVLYKYKSTGANKWLQVDYVKTADDSVMIITKDISERKEAEVKLMAYQEQLRALTSEMVLVEERERRRIASELHDQIGQNLALCKLKVATLENNPGHEELKSELTMVRRLLEVSIQDARSLIFDLSPPVLYELGFTAALEWLADRMQEQFHIPVEFESRLQVPEMESDRRVILFQVVRELLINVGKHSRATKAKVILSQAGPLLKIQVNDDGAGFDASAVFAPREQNGGFGFFSIRERLNYVGGTLDIKSRPGQGSQIVLTVPLPAQPIGRRPPVGLGDGAVAAAKEKS